MLRVALTGGIATGKSHVLGRLRDAGVPTIDADAVVHDALAPGSPAVHAIAARFGAHVVADAGGIDRARLGAIVFADPRARVDLEAILHPDVYRRIDDWFASLDRGRSPDAVRAQHVALLPDFSFAVADIPLLFETGHQSLFDRVIVVACPAALQMQRLKSRNGLSEDAARQRLAAQWPIEEKIQRADFVVDTSGTFDETDRQVDALLRRMKAEG